MFKLDAWAVSIASAPDRSPRLTASARSTRAWNASVMPTSPSVALLKSCIVDAFSRSPAAAICAICYSHVSPGLNAARRVRDPPGSVCVLAFRLATRHLSA